MRKMLTTFLFAILLVSCDFDIHEHEPPKHLVTSEHVFVVDDVAVVLAFKPLPITIYNPNNYTITVKIGNKEYSLAPFTELGFDYDGEQIYIK